MTAATLDRPAATRGSVRPISIGQLLGIEWRKMFSTRAGRWVAGLILLTLVGATAVSVAFAGEDGIPQTLGDFVEIGSLVLSLLLPVLVILVITTEWSQKTAVVTFTQEPRRGRVLLAKVLAGVVLGVLGAIAAIVVASAGLGISSVLGRDVSWSIGTDGVIALVAFTLLNLLMGAGFASVLQNTPAAIVVFYMQSLVWGILGAFAALQTAADWLDPNRALAWIAGAEWAGNWSQIAVSLSIWILLPLVAGVLRTTRRDIG